MIISGSVLFQPGFRPHPQFTSLNVPGPTTADQTGRSCLDRPSGWSISSLVKGRLGGKCHHDHHGKWARKTPDSACHAVCRASLWTPKSQNRERSHVTSPPPHWRSHAPLERLSHTAGKAGGLREGWRSGESRPCSSIAAKHLRHCFGGHGGLRTLNG